MSLDVTSPLDAILDLMRRLPPARVQSNLDALVRLCPRYADDLTTSVDVPLSVRTCTQTGKPYLCCDYNRDGDSYRSPFSDEYDPPLPDGAKSLPKHRALEVAANDAFDMYRDMYFDGGLCSVYIWDGDDSEHFAGAVLIKKVLDPPSKDSWDSIHVFEATDPPEQRGRAANYKLTSTVILSVGEHGGSEEGVGEIALTGSMTRQAESNAPVHSAQSHIINIGRLIEDLEGKMRNQLQEVYFGKTRDVVGELRSALGEGEEARRRELQRELRGRMKGGM